MYDTLYVFCTTCKNIVVYSILCCFVYTCFFNNQCIQKDLHVYICFKTQKFRNHMATWCISLHFTEQIVVPLESSYLKTCKKTLFMFLSHIVTKIYDKQEIRSERSRGSNCISMPNCVKIGWTAAEIWLFSIFQDGGRHLGFGLFTQNAQGWQDVTRQILIIYVLNINNQHLKKLYTLKPGSTIVLPD